MRALHTLRQLRSYHCREQSGGVRQTRECLLLRILLLTAVFGLVAYIPGLVTSLEVGHYFTALVDTLFYLWIIVLLRHPALDYPQRALGFLVPLWLLTFYLLFRYGIYGAGLLWLFIAPILTGILIGFAAGAYTLLLSALTLLILGIGIHAFGLFPRMIKEQPHSLWFLLAGNTVVLTALVLTAASTMIGDLEKTVRKLNRKLRELSESKDATIESFAMLAEFRDADTGDHIRRTREYVRIIAEELQRDPKYAPLLDDATIELLWKSAPLHDIGKIGIPDDILLKKGKLTPEEMEVMKKHTVYGYDVLIKSADRPGNNHFLRLAAEIAYTHQERWNGSGYPRGLTGEEIPLSGRIMAVADVYDALRSERPYKKAMSHEEAIDYLLENSGILFDPGIIAVVPNIEQRFRSLFRPQNNHK